MNQKPKTGDPSLIRGGSQNSNHKAGVPHAHSSLSSKKSATAGAANEKGKYNGEEDDIVCGRFPHMDVCACDI